MKSKWQGIYKYDNQKAQEMIGFPHTNFTLEIDISDDNTFLGSVEDDIRSGGMPGKGEINGEVFRDGIYFIKRMPIRTIIDPEKAIRESLNEKHPVIIYEGVIVEPNKYKGTWKFEKKWGFFLGFIPIRYCPGTGSWEMELVDGVHKIETNQNA